MSAYTVRVSTNRNSPRACSLIDQLVRGGTRLTGVQVEKWTGRRLAPDPDLPPTDAQLAYWAEVSTLIRPKVSPVGVLTVMAFRGHHDLIDPGAFQIDMLSLAPLVANADDETTADQNIQKAVAKIISDTRPVRHPARASALAALRNMPDPDDGDATTAYLTQLARLQRGEDFYLSDEVLSTTEPVLAEIARVLDVRSPTRTETTGARNQATEWLTRRHFVDIRHAVLTSPIVDIVKAARIVYPFHAFTQAIAGHVDRVFAEKTAMLTGASLLTFLSPAAFRELEFATTMLGSRTGLRPNSTPGAGR